MSLRVGLVSLLTLAQLSAQFGVGSALAGARVRFNSPVSVIPSCSCYEPTVTVDPKGRVFVTDGRGDEVAVSTNDGRTYRHYPAPPVPPGGLLLGDAIVQTDRRGRLVYSVLVGTGIQIAVSSTAGRTWDWNTFVGFPGVTAPLADRQWIGFGPHDAVYALWRTYGFVYWSATSSDGGRTFGPPEPFLPGEAIFSIGPPVLDGSEAVYVPVTLGLSPPQSVAVAVSPGGVSTTSFTLHTVARDDGVDYFPIAAVDRAGRVEVAWRGTVTGSRVVRVSRSANQGQSWARPMVWSGRDSVTSSPWINVRGSRVDVLWFGVTDGGPSTRLVLTRGSPNGSRMRQVVVSPFIAGSNGNTDFAHFALLRDGRVVAVWALDATAGVYLATEARDTHKP